LSPSREEAAIFIGINKVIARAIEQENNSSSSTIHPCPILNRYECPFDKKKSNNNNNKIKAEEKENSNLLDVDDLFNLSEIAFQIELALGKAQGMTKSNETIYETDFESGKLKEIYANYNYYSKNLIVIYRRQSHISSENVFKVTWFSIFEYYRRFILYRKFT